MGSLLCVSCVYFKQMITNTLINGTHNLSTFYKQLFYLNFNVLSRQMN